MTKLLSQSNQPAAFKLQDYLYDLFYQVETTGYAEKTLSTYREVNMTFTNQIEELNKQISILSVDLATSDEEIQLLKYQNSLLENSSRDADYYKDLASKLAKYVRVKSKKYVPDAHDDTLDIDDDDEESAELENEQIIYDAVEAKRKLKTKIIKTKSMKKAVDLKTVITSMKISKKLNYYYIMREINEISPEMYNWHLTDIRPDNEHTKLSNDYLCGETTDFNFPYVHYRTLKLSNDKKDAIALFLSLNDYSEETIENMFSIIANS